MRHSVPILFAPEGTAISDIDPEEDLQFGSKIDLTGTPQGNNNAKFTVPQNLKPGNYMLYVYLTYPPQNTIYPFDIMSLHSNVITIK